MYNIPLNTIYLHIFLLKKTIKQYKHNIPNSFMIISNTATQILGILAIQYSFLSFYSIKYISQLP